MPSAVSFRASSGETVHQIRSPSAHQSVKTEDLTRVQIKGDVVDDIAAARARQGHILHFHQHFANVMFGT